MKKYQMLFSGMVACALIMAGQPMTRAAEVVYVQGSVQVQSPQEIAWRKVEQGMQVDIGDMIRTARNSRADIALDADKKNMIRIDPKTQVVLNSAAAGTVDRLDLSKGRVYANLEDIKSGLSFEVNTPSAIAGVRGSSFSVYVEKDTDEIAAIKHTLFVKAFDVDKKEIADIMLPEGFKTYIDRFAEPSVFVQISTREFNITDNVLDRVLQHAQGRSGDEGAGRQDLRQGPLEELDRNAEERDLMDDISDIKESTDDSNTMDNIDDYRAEEHYHPEGGW